jgi:hypothetical protein
MRDQNVMETQSTSAQVPDDFKQIHGIGAGIELRLHNAGILSYRQLANMSPSEIMDAVGSMIGLIPDRILKQDWSGQARSLALNAAPTEPEDLFIEEQQDSPRQSDRQHYQMFTVELLLDETNTVRRTRLVHIPSKTENSWAGWDAKHLLRSIGDLAGLELQPEQPLERIEENQTPPPIAPEAEPVEPIWLNRTNYQVSEVSTRCQESEPPLNHYQSNQAVHAQFMLNLPEQKQHASSPYYYHADVYLRRIDQPKKWLARSLEGELTSSEPAVIAFDSQPLTPGTYRLETEVAVSENAPVQDLFAHGDAVGTSTSHIFWVYGGKINRREYQDRQKGWPGKWSALLY